MGLGLESCPDKVILCSRPSKLIKSADFSLGSVEIFQNDGFDFVDESS